MNLREEWMVSSGYEHGESKKQIIELATARFDIQRYESAEGENYSVRQDIYNEDTWYDEQGVINTHSNPYNEYREDMTIYLPIDTKADRGTYIWWRDSYWIITSKLKNNYAYKSAKLTECNNVFNYVNKYGKVIKYPCRFDANIQRSDFNYSDSVNTLDGREEVNVQYNSDTMNVKENDRLIFDGKTYKITSIFNHLRNSFNDGTSVGFLRLYTVRMDSSIQDDLDNNIANIQNKYEVKVLDNTINTKPNKTGKINYEVYKNGKLVNDEVLFNSEDTDIISINKNGEWKSNDIGDCNVEVLLKNNTDIKAIVNFSVDDVIEDIVEIKVYPSINEIKKGEEIIFDVGKYLNDNLLDEKLNIKDISDIKQYHYKLKIEDNKFTLKNLKEIKSGNVKIEISDNYGNKIIKEISLKGVW